MRLLVALLGLVLGILVGVTLLLANPLAWMRGLPPLSAQLAPAKVYSGNEFRGMEGGLGDLLGVGEGDRDLVLIDRSLAHVRAGIVLLPAGDGAPAALAIKVATTANENSLWRAQLGTHDYWSIFWSGEGSVFVSAYANYWTFARDSFFAFLRGGDRELLAPYYAVSAPSPVGEALGLTGASGRYAGFTGEIRELMYPAAPADGKNAERAIAIKANPPPVVAR